MLNRMPKNYYKLFTLTGVRYLHCFDLYPAKLTAVEVINFAPTIISLSILKVCQGLSIRKCVCLKGFLDLNKCI